MNTHYTTERHVQILIALLKEHGIRYIIASPGATNLVFVASIQSDPFFTIYSSVDERSAAYMACGLAAETGEAVAISCTGATASRNYLPGLTEAFYRQLPVLAITATQHIGKVGHYVPQVIDRSVAQKDVVKFSLNVGMVHDAEEEHWCQCNINRALLELKKDGGGPVHLNVETRYSRDFSVKELPPVRKIDLIREGEQFPPLPQGKKVVYIGSHKPFTEDEVEVIDRFCSQHNAVVFGDHTCNYNGRYRILDYVFSHQQQYTSPFCKMELLIHLGTVAGGSPRYQPEQVWRVHPDGVARDTFGKLTKVFQMDEISFFSQYLSDSAEERQDLFRDCKKEQERLTRAIPELPFSNPWIAKKLAPELPGNCVLHLGILNSLRSWNFFTIDGSVRGYSNTGGFGIDGGLSSLIGASLAHKDRLYFGVVGDLAFFYDMNSIGNRFVGKNVRILLVNNGCGTEFKNYDHPAARFGADADYFMAARGHFGHKSPRLVKGIAESLGFKYLAASSKDEFEKVYKEFVTPEITDESIVFEVFTSPEDESDALKIIKNLEADLEGTAKRVIKGIIGQENASKLKKILGK